jgi:hypothetical protein
MLLLHYGVFALVMYSFQMALGGFGEIPPGAFHFPEKADPSFTGTFWFFSDPNSHKLPFLFFD